MKTYFTILSMLIISLNLSAQIAATKDDFKVSWGAEYEFPKKHEDLGFWKGIKGGYVNISYEDGKSMVIQRFDSKMKYIGEETIDLSGFPSNFINEGIRRVGDKFYWFYSLWDKGKEKEQLFSQQLDVDAGKLSGSSKKIVETSKLTGDYVNKGWYNLQVANKYSFSKSRDKETLLITVRYPPLEKDDSKNYDRMGWFVFNSSLEKVWSKENQKMPYTEEMMDNLGYDVDSKGNVYLLASVREPNWKQLKKEKKGFEHFEVLRLNEKSDGFGKIILNPGARWVRSIHFFEDGAGDMLLSGFYSNSEKGTGTNGIFLMKVEQGTLSAKEVKKGFYEFPTEVLKQFESEKTQRKLEKKDEKAKEDGDEEDAGAEASHLVLQEIETLNDGAIVISAEEYYYKTSRSADGRSQSTTYYYNDIIAMKINSNGDLGWVHKIPKRQEGGRGRGGLSFEMFTMNGSQYYFYLDNIKNLDLSTDQAPAVHRDGAGGFLVYTKIDQNGKMTKGKIMDLREEEVTVYGSEFELVDETQIVTRAKVKKLSKILSLSLLASK